jgi:hypothetical protein
MIFVEILIASRSSANSSSLSFPPLSSLHLQLLEQEQQQQRLQPEEQQQQEEERQLEEEHQLEEEQELQLSPFLFPLEQQQQQVFVARAKLEAVVVC